MFLNKFFCNEMDENYLHMYQFNSIALPKIKLQKTRTKNCHKNQTSRTMNLKYEHRLCYYPQTRTFAFKPHFMFSYMNLTIQVN